MHSGGTMLLRGFTVPQQQQQQQQQKTPRVRWEDEEQEDDRPPFHRLDLNGDDDGSDPKVDTTVVTSTPSVSSSLGNSGEAVIGRAGAGVVAGRVSATGGEPWPSPLRKLPRAGMRPSTFQKILAISPIRKHSEIRSDEEEKLDLPQPRTRESLCTSSSRSTSSRSSSCSGATACTGSNIQETGARKADKLVVRSVWDDSVDQDDTTPPTMAAPAHASSSPLSSPNNTTCVSVVRGRTASSMVHDDNTTNLKELLHVADQQRSWPRPLSQSLSPAAIASLSQAREEEEGASLEHHSPKCGFDTRQLSPQPLAVFHSKKGTSKSGKASRYQRHSSTAVHEPRARCGCRGITVQVNCGPLGLSLEASYRMERGLVLKQAWSDCSADKGMFEHSILVQNMPGRDGRVGELNVGLNKEGRSSLSGLIKVQAVCIENVADARATPTATTVMEPPLPLRPGVIVRSSSLSSGREAAQRSVLEGVLEVENGDILVRVNDVQVSKKSFADVAHLLDRAKRPTRLTFVRHACGRRFVSREKDGSFAAAAREPPGRTAFGLRRRGKRGKAGRGYEKLLCAGSAGRADSRSLSLSPQKLTKCYRQIETEEDTCPVAALLRARRQLPSGGMEEWHEVVAARGRLWRRLINDLPPDSHSDRAKLRKLANDSCAVDRHARKGRVGLTVRRLMGDYQRLVCSSEAHDDGAGCTKAGKVLAARVWEDVDRTMSPRHPGHRKGILSASLRGGGGFGCPAHFTEGSRHAVFRVAYATASTLQLVSGMSYMAALMLVQEPVEAIAYATLVILLQNRKMRLLYPMGDVDLLDAYHLCGGRVVTYRAPSVGHYAHDFGTERGVRRGSSAATEGAGVVFRDHGDGLLDGGGDRTPGREMLKREEESTKQVVVGKVLPRLVRAFGRALKRRLPTLHKHFCTHAIPMSFLCAEWFTTAYARNTPLPLALCAFDLFSVHLDDGMIRLGLGILEVLAPTLEALNSKEILLQYGDLTANVYFKDVLQRVLATQPRQAPLVQTSSAVVGEVCMDSEKSSCLLS